MLELHWGAVTLKYDETPGHVVLPRALMVSRLSASISLCSSSVAFRSYSSSTRPSPVPPEIIVILRLMAEELQFRRRGELEEVV